MDSGEHGPHGETAVLHVVVATDPAPESATHLYRTMEEATALVLLLTQSPVTRQPAFNLVVRKQRIVYFPWKNVFAYAVYVDTNFMFYLISCTTGREYRRE